MAAILHAGTFLWRLPLCTASRICGVKRLAVLTALTSTCMVCSAEQVRPESVTHLNDTLLQALQQRNGVPGMAAAIMKDGKLVWQGSAGFADVERKQPVTPSTAFRLASVSKFVTALMLARLWEQEKIDLSAPVSRYVPEFPSKQYPISSVQLASHTAGIPHYSSVLDAQRDERAKLFVTVTDGLALFKDRPLVNRPGSAYFYSSYGVNLLSAVMERAANEDFDTMLAKLAARAGAASLTAELPGNGRGTWSKLYDASGNELARGNISYNRAGGGMVSTASDLVRVGALALDTGYISGATLKRFTTPVVLDDGAPVQDERFLMGIGFRLSVDQHGRSFFHYSGVTRGARSHISVYPAQRLVVAVLSNASWTSAMDSTASALAEPVLGDGAPGKCKAGMYRYKGTYKKSDISGSMRVEAVGGLCKATLVADNALGKWLANGAGPLSFALYGNGESMSLVTPLGLFPADVATSSVTLTLMAVPLTLRLTRTDA